ncbi:BLUF domain-containing protein [Sphingomonas bacterium]|uniref:BLUF domain-containing protein n=1 Tax=Sphingomonas bacterium TaxID=1895847 RepID=UPI001575E949|nr:BLUF domain-containing protein [Sphingomonas bacterium]
MRQIIYQSVATTRDASEEAPEILRGARPFNGLNGVTGLLCASDGKFLQVLEGPDESVDIAMARILKDPRHHRIEILVNEEIEERAFGDWTMAYRDQGHPADLLEDRLRAMIRHAPPAIADRFRQFLTGDRRPPDTTG